MDLDAHTIDNLNLLADEEGDERGSVLALLRHCVVRWAGARMQARTCDALGARLRTVGCAHRCTEGATETEPPF